MASRFYLEVVWKIKPTVGANKGGRERESTSKLARVLLALRRVSNNAEAARIHKTFKKCVLSLTSNIERNDMHEPPLSVHASLRGPAAGLCGFL